MGQISSHGFEDDGRPVPIVLPDVYDELKRSDDESLEVERFLIELVAGVRNSREAGEHVVVACYLLKLPGTFATLRELGMFLGVSHTAARKKVSKFKRQLRRNLAKFAPAGFQPGP